MSSETKCATCFAPFVGRRATSKYCSKPCAWKKNGGKNKKPEVWWTNQKGYTEGFVTLADGSRRRVKQHRFVVEQAIGRRLSPDEDVHHINGIKSDNRVENLEVISHSAHSTLTGIERPHANGYKLSLTDEERARRSARFKDMHRRRRERTP